MRVTLTLQTTIDTLFKPFWNAYCLKKATYCYQFH